MPVSEKRCSKCGKLASQCLALGMVEGSIARNGQCRVCNAQAGLGIEYEGYATDLTSLRQQYDPHKYDYLDQER